MISIVVRVMMELKLMHWELPSGKAVKKVDGIGYLGKYLVPGIWVSGGCKLKTNRKFPFACFKVGWEAK